MISAKDVYVDKHDNITTDPSQYAAQIATAGCYLDDRTARRYGISDALVSVQEPNARRIVMGKQSQLSIASRRRSPDNAGVGPRQARSSTDSNTGTSVRSVASCRKSRASSRLPVSVAASDPARATLRPHVRWSSGIASMRLNLPSTAAADFARMAPGELEARFRAFKAACAERFSWSRSAKALYDAAREAAGLRGAS